MDFSALISTFFSVSVPTLGVIEQSEKMQSFEIIRAMGLRESLHLFNSYCAPCTGQPTYLPTGYSVYSRCVFYVVHRTLDDFSRKYGICMLPVCYWGLQYLLRFLHFFVVVFCSYQRFLTLRVCCV